MSDSSKGGQGTGEETKSACLPNIFKMQQKNSDKYKDQNNQQEQITTPPISSPDSNPPPYQDSLQYINCDPASNNLESVPVNKCHKDEWSDTKDETTVPLLEKIQNNK